MNAFHTTHTPYTENLIMSHESSMSHESPAFQSFVGVDLHKCTVTLGAVDPRSREIACLTTSTKNTDKIGDFLAALPKPVQMAVEACPFCEWFIDHYRPFVDRIEIADATELANLRGKRRKTDRNDAMDIAQRLARGDCPLGWIADEPTSQLRKLGRHWRRLSQILCRAKHGMRSMLHAANLQGPAAFNGASAQRWLLAYGQKLKEAQWHAFTDLLDLVQAIERQRQRLRLRIIQANRQPQFASAMTILKSVPGIDEVWGCVIASEVGPFSRFPNADALEYWAGLTADNKTSAGVTRCGHITKAGSATLRWALGKAAMCLCRSDGAWESKRQRLIEKRGKPIANTAMARRLLHTLLAMMRDGTTFVVQKPTDHTAKANRARMRRDRGVIQTPSGKKTNPSKEVAVA